MKYLFLTTLALILMSCSHQVEQTQAQRGPDSSKSSPEQATSSPKDGRTYLKLVDSGETNQRGNPIFHLHLYRNGNLIKRFSAVSGRAHTQSRDRDIAGNESPLPNGRYDVNHTAIPGSTYETGELFLPIKPTFETQRFDLGIHYDPSYNLDNGEDGTAGCIGLINRQELDELLDYVRTYKPSHLTVNI